MAWTGLAVRLLYVALAHTYLQRARDDHFEFGWEMGRLARALATGRGYADPFNGHSGPSAWCPPLYPLLLAGCFKVFGVYTRGAAAAILTLNCVFSAFTAPAVYRLARRGFAGNAKAAGIALWSGWLWALYPAAMQYAVKWVWDMSLTTFLFAWMLVFVFSMRADNQNDRSGIRRWAAFGGLWGLIALSNASLLAFLPAAGVWVLWPAGRRAGSYVKSSLAAVCIGAVCFAAVLSPWVLRNEVALHHFIPMRDNLGAELYESVRPANAGFPWGTTVSLAPASAEFQSFRALGEFAYSARQGVRAKALIAANPGRFLRYVLERADFFWVSVPQPIAFGSVKGLLVEAGREANYALLSVAGLLGLGLALRRREAGAWLFFWALAFVPLVYYGITVQARFRHPLEPVLTVLAVYLFQSAERNAGTKRNRRLSA